ncbi:MAG: hypothetical protein U5J63_00755 [Fodinibius sp.]|nr:hypothetical protein [Fodinibius sp.]
MPQNDSLRTFVGQQLVYADFRDQGFETLYPLFEQQSVTDETQTLVHTEIGYMDYEQQKSFYKTYPAFFSDSLQQSVNRKYRQQEGFMSGVQASFSSDNINSQTGEIGVFTEWGNRQDITHRISVSEGLVSTDIIGASNLANLLHIDYQYRHAYQSPSRQLTLGAGAYLENQSLRATLQAGYWISRDSTYTSIQSEFSPVLTNTALGQNLNQVEGQLYREDYWFNSWIQSAASGRGRWYSDGNISYEGLMRFFLHKPISTPTR